MREYVIMADIVDSSSHDGKKLMEFFSHLVDRANSQFKKQIKSPLTITLGDEFQGVTDSLISAIEMIIYLEEKLIKTGGLFQLSYVVNHGEIETDINTVEANKMLGSGLTTAREQMVICKKMGVRFHVEINDKQKMKNLNNSLFLYQHLIESWKEKDYTVVSLFIEGKSYKEVARITGKDDSTIWRKEKSLRVKVYNVCKDLILDLAS